MKKDICEILQTRNEVVEKLNQRILAANSHLCVGLDIHYHEGIPAELFYHKNVDLIDQTNESSAAYKFQLSGYLAYNGEGIKVLHDSIHYLKRIYPTIPAVLDAKVNDIGISMQEYARFAFDYLNADAITANPLLGRDANEPLLARNDKLIYFLASTTNPDAAVFQSYMGYSGPLYRFIAEEVDSWNVLGNCGLVVAGTHSERIEDIRAATKMPFLIPGMGAQGAQPCNFVPHSKGSYPASYLVNVSRGVTHSSDPKQSAGEAALKINTAEGIPTESQRKAKILAILKDCNALSFGNFKLASGEYSNFYINLRLLSGRPDLLREVIPQLKDKADNIDYDFIATVPTAGMPFAIPLSLATIKPMVWVRKEAKDHGAKDDKNKGYIEGGFDIEGKRGLLVDDVITHGTTKMFGIEKLREAGALVNDILVVVDRRDKKLETMDGINIHSLVTIKDIDELS